MASKDILAVLNALDRAGMFSSVDCGWGVDALLGRQTRAHDDLDLVIDVDQVDAVESAPALLGYQSKVDEMPMRFVLAANGDRRIDLHSNYFDETGYAHQRLPDGRLFTCRITALNAFRMIDGRDVRFLSPELQLASHLGYEPDESDRQDVALLCCAYRLPLPAEYAKRPG